MSTNDNKKLETKAGNTAESKTTIPGALQWPELKICIISQWLFDRLETDQQEDLQKEYGDGLVVMNWIRARKMDKMGLLMFEKSTWSKIPETIQKKLLEEYGEEDGLRIFADDFLNLIDIKKYPTSQRGNSLAFYDLRGQDYVHTLKPSCGWCWKKLATVDGFTGGYWAQDNGDSWLKAEINKLTDELWDIYLSIKVLDDDNKKGGSVTTEDEAMRELRNDQLKKWRRTIKDRYDSFANYEFDKIAYRIKDLKDKEHVAMNDPEKCSGLLPCLNGVYILKSGEFRSAKKSDYTSYFAPTVYKKVAYDQNVRDALDLFFDKAKDKERAKVVETYFWELVGTALYPTLRKDTKAMTQWIGTKTNNGKTTLVRALMACLGDADETGLAQSVRPETFAKIAGANTSTLTPDLATIKWARLVFVSEPDENLRINWAQIKDLSGAGFMKINPKNAPVYKISAQFSMFWDTNYYLIVDDPTIFARGTMKLIPFEHQFGEADRDADIDKKLSTDDARSYILFLMLEGLRRYMQNNGFSVPDVCKKMVDDYESSSDKIGEFLDQNYVKTGKPSDKILLKEEVYTRYSEWSTENGCKGIESYSNFLRKIKNRQGVILGDRNNAKALVGYVKIEDVATKAVPFDGMDPLDWYIKNFIIENETKTEQDSGNTPEQIQMEGQPEPMIQPCPPLTLEELRKDYEKRTFEVNNFRQALDMFGLLAELLRKKWNLEPNSEDLGKSKIKGLHIATAAELEERERNGRQRQFKALQAGVRDHLNSIKDENDRAAIKQLIKSGALARFLKDEPAAYASIFRASVVDGDPLEVAIGREADRIAKNGDKAPTVDGKEKTAQKAEPTSSKNEDTEKLKTTEATKFWADYILKNYSGRPISYKFFDLIQEDIPAAPSYPTETVTSKEKVLACMLLLQEQGHIIDFTAGGNQFDVKWA